MKNIVIAGGTSFIGLSLILKLANMDYNITAFTRNINKETQNIQKTHDNVKFVSLDINEYENMGKYVKDCDFYIPFTWDGTKREDRDNKEKNKNSYVKILASIKSIAKHTSCKKIILPGTFSEYGNQSELITENTPCKPVLQYGKYKLKLYEEAKKYCKKNTITLIETRLFNIYGTRDSDAKMLNTVIRKMISGESVDLTQCTQILDFIHIDDVISALILLIENDIANGCYNICADDHRTLKSYIEEMYSIVQNENCNLCFGNIEYENNNCVNVIGSNDKLKSAILWKPKVCFSDGIKEIIEHYKKQINV